MGSLRGYTGLISVVLSLCSTLCHGATPLGDPLPKWLGSSTSPPWAGTKPGGEPPDTGVTRSYNFTITRDVAAPDGYLRSLILINGKYLGPTIEANWGDTLEIEVHNQLKEPDEGLSVHWHGQPQRLTPWMDGVPGVSQCPIAPGRSFTYKFRAETFGTSWYHSHLNSQYLDGLFGAMVVYGPSSADYDIDIGPVMIYDYLHFRHDYFTKLALGSPRTFLALDNNLINGKGPFDCSKALNGVACDSTGLSYAKFHFKKGKTHRIRLVNSGGTDNQKFTIDGHEMTVIAQDYVPIKPYNTSVVTLGVGQRSDVLVYASGNPTDAVWMRGDMDTNQFCGNQSTVQSHAKAAIYYDQADQSQWPTTSATSWQSQNCQNDPLSKQIPFYSMTPGDPDVTTNLNISAAFDEKGRIKAFVNGIQYKADVNSPILLSEQQGDASLPKNLSVYNYKSKKSIRAIWYNAVPTSHPIHLHGHDFWILAEGYGEWDGKITNSNNPPRRDTHLLAPGGLDGSTPSYIVLQYDANPGVWPFHCHVSLHQSAGILVNSVERPDIIRSYNNIPGITAQTCNS